MTYEGPHPDLPYECPHPFQLDIRQVLKACREAHTEGRLGYQLGHEACRYRYDDQHPTGKPCGCAIGVALPDKIMPWVFQSSNIWRNAAESKALILPLDPEEELDLRTLQDWHDEVCTFQAYEHPKREALVKFENMLTKLEAKYL